MLTDGMKQAKKRGRKEEAQLMEEPVIKDIIDKFSEDNTSAKCINKCDLFSAALRSNAFVKNAVTFL